MKIENIPSLKQRVLEILPVSQSELRKRLGIDHRDVSKLVIIMMKENIIKKKKLKTTYLLELIRRKKEISDIKGILIFKGKFSPCCGCGGECFPANCHKLIEWAVEEDKNMAKTVLT